MLGWGIYFSNKNFKKSQKVYPPPRGGGAILIEQHQLKMLLSIRSKHSSLFLFSNINRVAFESAIIWSDEYPNHLSFPPKFLSNLF